MAKMVLVVYDGCPRNYANGVWWSRTQFGQVTTESCPVGSYGKASRSCDNTLEGWQTPDIFNCTSDSFMTLRKLVIIAAKVRILFAEMMD